MDRRASPSVITMGTMRAWLLVLVGCSSGGECLEDVCADFENATKYPGPCRAGEVFSAVRTFEYDMAGRLTLVTRIEDEPAYSDKDGNHPRRVVKTTGAWSYD